MRNPHERLQMARQLADRHRQLSGRGAFSAETVAGRGALYVYEVIGEDWWTGGGVTSKKVADALAQMTTANVKALDIYINSPGGDIFEAKAIVAQIRRFEGERIVHVDGIAASAASYIAMAGDKIITAPDATWMIHEVWSLAVGTAADMLATAAVLDMENRTFAEAYAKRSGQKVEDVLAWMAAETWMNAATAKERGFTDEIADESTSDAEVMAALRDATSTLRALSAAEGVGR